MGSPELHSHWHCAAASGCQHVFTLGYSNRVVMQQISYCMAPLALTTSMQRNAHAVYIPNLAAGRLTVPVTWWHYP